MRLTRLILGLFLVAAAARAAEPADEEEAESELESLRQAEAKAGLLRDQPAARDALAIGMGEMSPVAQDLAAALGPSVDGSPLADPVPAGGAFARLPELAGISEDELRAKYDIPVELNDAVVAYIRFFQHDVRAHFEKWLSRSTRFMPMMRAILEKEGLPLDLVYLSMIESGFNAYAYSWAKASGLWQFVAGTSVRYGLVSDFWVDERRDPAKATWAAAQYLRELYHRFHGNWFLAWAGYNAGEGKIDRAIRNEQTRDFWRMRKNGRTLRAETRHYVPKLIAAALIAKHPDRFGFHVEYEPPWAVDTVFVPGAVEVSVIARAAGITVDKVRELNPALRRYTTPPEGWQVNLPQGSAKAFAEAFARVAPEERLTVTRHKVERGESLNKIARAYGVPEKAILGASGLRSFRQVHLGTVLTIPAAHSKTGLAKGKLLVEKRAQGRVRAKKAVRGAPPPPRRAGVHVVQQGDTLWSIAQKFGTTVNRLKAINGLRGRRARALHIGQEIAVREDV